MGTWALLLAAVGAQACAPSITPMSPERLACLDAGGPVEPAEVVRDADELRELLGTLLGLEGAPDSLAAVVYSRGDSARVWVEDSAAIPANIHYTFGRVVTQFVLAGEPSRGSALHLIARSQGEDVVELSARYSTMCRPELANRDEFMRAMTRAQAQLMRNGTVVLALWIDETGTPVRIEVTRGSGDDVLDALAVGVGYTARYYPAMNDGRPVPVRLSIPITFRTN